MHILLDLNILTVIDGAYNGSVPHLNRKSAVRGSVDYVKGPELGEVCLLDVVFLSCKFRRG